MSDKDDSLRLILEEQRRDYDYLQHIYERAGAKESFLLTATFALIAYLFYPSSDSGTDILARFGIPHELYGIAIFVVATAFIFVATFRLMLNVFGGNAWETAYETPKSDYTYSTTETLEYYKQRYDAAYKVNVKSYLKRNRSLQLWFFTILISAIILIMIKTMQ